MDTTAREVINQGNYSIDLLETVECNSEERYKIEYNYIQGYGDLAVNCLTGISKEPGYKQQKDKEYYEANKDKLKLKIKDYNEKNKEKLSARKKEKVLCECGYIGARTHVARHKKSKKHMEFIASLSSGNIHNHTCYHVP
jgi:hypothetical protein